MMIWKEYWPLMRDRNKVGLDGWHVTFLGLRSNALGEFVPVIRVLERPPASASIII